MVCNMNHICYSHVLMVSVADVVARSRALRMYRFTGSTSSGESGLPPFCRFFKGARKKLDVMARKEIVTTHIIVPPQHSRFPNACST